MRHTKRIAGNGPPRMATIAAGLLIGSVVCVQTAKAQLIFTDAITREVTVFNKLPAPTIDANTREVTIFSKLASLAAMSDAITREFTIDNTILFTGDFNNDFAVTAADIPLFAAVMADPNPHPAALEAADLNCDGITNGIDVQTVRRRHAGGSRSLSE